MISKSMFDVFEEFRGRVRYRIVSSFAISFGMWNWYDISVMIFDDSPFWLKAFVFKWNLTFVDGFLIPLAFAVGWMYLVPLINYGTESFRMKVVNKYEDRIKTNDFVYRSTLLREKVRSLESNLLDARSKLDEEVEKGRNADLEVRIIQDFLFKRFNQYAANRDKYVNYVRDADRIAKESQLLKEKIDEPAKIAPALDFIINTFEPMNTIPIAYLEGDSAQALREFKASLKDFKDARVILIQEMDFQRMENLKNNFISKIVKMVDNVGNFKPSISFEQLNNARENEIN